MGIRDLSYFGWSNIHQQVDAGIVGNSASFYTIVEANGTLYLGGRSYITPSKLTYILKKSVNGGHDWNNIYPSSFSNYRSIEYITYASGSFYIAALNPVSSSIWKSSDMKSFVEITPNVASSNYNKIDIDSSGNLFCIKSARLIFSSSDAGLSWGYRNVGPGTTDQPTDIAVSYDDKIFVTYATALNLDVVSIIRLTNSGSSASTVLSTMNGAISGLTIDKMNKSVFAFTGTNNVFENTYFLSSSNDGTSWKGTNSAIDLGSIDFKIKSSERGDVYAVGLAGMDNAFESSTKFPIYVSMSGTGIWTLKSVFTASSDTIINQFHIDSKDNLYLVGQTGKFAFARRGHLMANSESLGPRMLNTSFGYTYFDSLTSSILGTSASGTFTLNNVSEFPHSSGLFQMPNMVLGTKTS